MWQEGQVSSLFSTWYWNIIRYANKNKVSKLLNRFRIILHHFAYFHRLIERVKSPIFRLIVCLRVDILICKALIRNKWFFRTIRRLLPIVFRPIHDRCCCLTMRNPHVRITLLIGGCRFALDFTGFSLVSYCIQGYSIRGLIEFCFLLNRAVVKYCCTL